MATASIMDESRHHDAPDEQETETYDDEEPIPLHMMCQQELHVDGDEADEQDEDGYSSYEPIVAHVPPEFLENGRFPKKSYYKPTGRPRGRPRGSKANPERHLAEPKMKRPVGRPRKFADDHPRYLPKGSRPRGRPRGSGLGPRPGIASGLQRQLPLGRGMQQGQEERRERVEPNAASDPLRDGLETQVQTKEQSEESDSGQSGDDSLAICKSPPLTLSPAKRKGPGRPRKFPDDHPRYLPKGSRPRGRPRGSKNHGNRVPSQPGMSVGTAIRRPRGRGRPPGRGRGRPPGRAATAEVEVLIQGEPEMLELPGDSYYFLGRHNGHESQDPLGEGDDCTVENEYVDGNEEADVDTIAIEQEEEYEEEDKLTDDEGDIEIHEESLEV